MRVLSTRQQILGGLLAAGCLLFLFFPGILGSQVPGFRDAYHFYYPQAVWLDARAADGELFPRWNHSEALGTSVVAQSSSALFYPLRVFWLLPYTSVAQRFSIFIIAHLLLAAIGTGLAARTLKCSTWGSLLAAVSFSLSVPVFFQHSNLIYLCSAAWIGFAIAGTVLMTRPRLASQIRGAGLLCIALSMMVLGGDTHTAVNACLVSGLAVAVVGIRGIWKRSGDSRQEVTARLSGLLCCVLAIACAVGLSSVQWVPSLRWAKLSQRFEATPQAESNSEELLEVHRRIARFAESAGLPRHSTYDFSIPPWYVATTAYPTLLGHYTPTNSRWIALFPAEGRMWIPSLYFGLVPLLCVISLWRQSREFRANALLLLVGFAFLASLGNYTLIWIARELVTSTGQSLPKAFPADSTTGIYWMLTNCIPAYDGFRYPGKWTVWSVAGCCLLAGYQLTVSRAEDLSCLLRSRACQVIVFIASILVATSCLMWLAFRLQPSLLESVNNWLMNRSRDIWLGSPNALAVTSTLFVAGLLPLITIGVLRYVRINPHVICILTLLEMTAVCSTHIAFVAPPRIESPPSRAAFNAAELSPAPSIPARLDESQHPRPIKVWVDFSEANIAADMRTDHPNLSQQAAYQSRMLLGKLASVTDIGNLAAAQSLTPRLTSRLRSVLARQDDLSRHQPELDRWLGALGVTHRLARSASATETRWEWHPIEATSALCEFYSTDEVEPQPSQGTDNPIVHWHWTSSSELEIELSTPAEGTLLIRQFNDGGWRAVAAPLQDQWTELSVLGPAPTPFLELRVPAGTTRIALTRKWFW